MDQGFVIEIRTVHNRQDPISLDIKKPDRLGPGYHINVCYNIN